MSDDWWPIGNERGYSMFKITNSFHEGKLEKRIIKYYILFFFTLIAVYYTNKVITYLTYINIIINS